MGCNFANIITGSRVLCSIAMLFFPTFSIGYYVTYTICGVTDMADGAVARRTGCASDFGSKFDSAADLLFVAISLIKLIPELEIPAFIWTWMVILVFTRVFNIVAGTALGHKVLSYHSKWDKITGALFFILPFTIGSIDVTYTAIVVLSFATISATYEAYRVNTLPTYDEYMT